MFYAARRWLVCLAFAFGCPTARLPAEEPAGPGPADTLCDRIDAALAHARDARRLDAGVHGAWQVVHGILAFGPQLPLAHDGEVSSALDYLLDGGRLVGWQLRPGSPGVIAVVEEGSTMGQGHPDQWLGYLSQCGIAPPDAAPGPGGIPLDTPLRVGGVRTTLAALLAQAQHDIRPGQEATWTLMALATYLPPDASWTARDGTPWTTEDVVRMEAEAEIHSAACGGAHRLYGLAAALRAHAAAGLPRTDDDGWEVARNVVADAIASARNFQQPDGSFSVHSFERPGTSVDVIARLGATGHVFEVLALALDDEDLDAVWVRRAAERLVVLLEQTADLDVECGALYHAAHGLALYRRRICPSPPAAGAEARSHGPVLPARRGG